MVTLAEIARRAGLSKQRISQLARTDPEWPVPEEQWQKVGRYFLLPWEPVAAYLAERKPAIGVHHATRIRRKASTPTDKATDDH